MLSFDNDAARLAGRINADLERAGRVIGLPDVMIAAMAIRNGLVLVTGNTAHFEHVRAAKYDLFIDNWRPSTAANEGTMSDLSHRTGELVAPLAARILERVRRTELGWAFDDRRSSVGP